jgi:PKD repeat protein
MRRWGLLVVCLASACGGDDDATFDDAPPSIDGAVAADGATLSVTITADTTYGMAPLVVQLDATVSGAVGAVAYAWDFADGDTGSDASAGHTFAAQGIYEVTVTATDSTGAAGGASTTVYAYDATNEAPVITVPGLQTVPEDQPLALSIGVSDPDSGPMPLLVHLDASRGTLTLASTAGLTFSEGDGTDDVGISFTGSQTATTAALTSMVFNAPGENGAVTVSINVDDQGATGEGGPLTSSSTVTIDVTGVNSPPTISAIADVTIVEGGTSGTIDFTIADVDNDPATLGLTVTSSNEAVMPAAGVVLGGSGTARTLSATPASEAFGETTITVTVSDGGDSASEDFLFTVTGVNDAPVNVVPGAQTTAEDTNLFFPSSISASDVDATTLQLTISVTGGAASLSTDEGLTFSAGDGLLDTTMTFSGTIAAVNAALTNLRYTPFANFTGAASLSITTSDLGQTGTGGTLTDTDTIAITVTAVNDAPVNTVPGPQTVTAGMTKVFSIGNGNAISTSDVDAGSGAVRVTLTATGGTLTLAGTSGLTFVSGDGTNDAAMTFDGALTAVNAALNGLSYAAGAAGAGTVTIVVDDRGLTGGPAASDSDSVSITKL